MLVFRILIFLSALDFIAFSQEDTNQSKSAPWSSDLQSTREKAIKAGNACVIIAFSDTPAL